jgi:hypothetical protein
MAVKKIISDIEQTGKDIAEEGKKIIQAVELWVVKAGQKIFVDKKRVIKQGEVVDQELIDKEPNLVKLGIVEKTLIKQ